MLIVVPEHEDVVAGPTKAGRLELSPQVPASRRRLLGAFEKLIAVLTFVTSQATTL